MTSLLSGHTITLSFIFEERTVLKQKYVVKVSLHDPISQRVILKKAPSWADATLHAYFTAEIDLRNMNYVLLLQYSLDAWDLHVFAL